MRNTKLGNMSEIADAIRNLNAKRQFKITEDNGSEITVQTIACGGTATYQIGQDGELLACVYNSNSCNCQFHPLMEAEAEFVRQYVGGKNGTTN